jgi:tetratricopeptide (TPR) repeat protein
MAKIGRNARCPCGSGKKYKKCCLAAAESAQVDDLTEYYRQMVVDSAILAEALAEVTERLAFHNELLERVWDRIGELARQRRFEEAIILCELILDECDEAADEFERSMMAHRARGQYLLAADCYQHVGETTELPEQCDGFGGEEREPDPEMSGAMRRLAAPGRPDDASSGG